MTGILAAVGPWLQSPPGTGPHRSVLGAATHAPEPVPGPGRDHSGRPAASLQPTTTGPHPRRRPLGTPPRLQRPHSHTACRARA